MALRIEQTRAFETDVSGVPLRSFGGAEPSAEERPAPGTTRQSGPSATSSASPVGAHALDGAGSGWEKRIAEEIEGAIAWLDAYPLPEARPPADEGEAWLRQCGIVE